MPKYLYKLIPLKNNTYDTCSTHSVGTYFCRTNAFKYSFFPYTIWEWNKLDLQLCSEKSFKKFRNTLLKFGRPTPDLIYQINHHLGLKLFTRLKLGLSHLNEHRFKHTYFVHVFLKSSQLRIFSCTAIIIQHSLFLS